MAAHPLARLDVSTRVLKRAQYEAFEFELQDGTLFVRNGSHLDPENHEYEVSVSNRIPTECECPADEAYEGACKHRVAVAIRTPVLEAATHAHLAADGSGSAKPLLTEEEYLTERDTTHPPGAGGEPEDDFSDDETDDDSLADGAPVTAPQHAPERRPNPTPPTSGDPVLKPTRYRAGLPPE